MISFFWAFWLFLIRYLCLVELSVHAHGISSTTMNLLRSRNSWLQLLAISLWYVSFASSLLLNGVIVGLHYQVLVALQAALTVFGNITLCIAAFRINKLSSKIEVSEKPWWLNRSIWAKYNWIINWRITKILFPFEKLYEILCQRFKYII